MNDAALNTIAATGFTVAFFHAAIPTHWLPFVLVARARGWTHGKTLAVSMGAGLGHVLLTSLLGLGIAWLVIVAAEMLTGRPGVGGFLWQEYNALIYEQIILCILTIGGVGFVLDRLDRRTGCDPAHDGDHRRAHSSRHLATGLDCAGNDARPERRGRLGLRPGVAAVPGVQEFLRHAAQ